MSAAAKNNQPATGISPVPPWAHGICAGLHASGCREVIYVPDNPLSHILRVLARDYPDMRATLATREEEALGIAAGLYLGGARPALMMQSSGLGNTLNALGSLLVAYQIPALFIISMRGDPGEWNWAQVPMGRAVVPVLNAFGIQHAAIERSETAEETIRTAAALAFGTRQPVACLLPRRLTTSGGRS
jgi:sulfopyruvate decarboxylase alpha subunit